MIPGSEQTESGENGGEGGEGGREGEIPTLITSRVTAPAGRCQNPTLSDVRRVLANGKVGSGRERKEYRKINEDRKRTQIKNEGEVKKKEFYERII